MGITNTDTWKKLESRWEQGFDLLMPAEQQAIALWWLEAETMNGTLNQFFWNSAGDMALLALTALQELDLPVTTKALQSALRFFGDDYPVDRDARMRMLEIIETEHGTDAFMPASRIIQDLPEDFVLAAVDRLEDLYARRLICPQQ
ncbi:DMP19 family protein [Undibacterium sp. JH2W]|uniref:DMP19 family protein n=1 Tax=Undibacterium sp. JH2W TaxID=3413037 RepID=UPI003BEFA137